MAKKRIKDLSHAETDGYLAVDNATNGTGKMNTSVIFNNFAGKFVPNSTNAVAGKLYIYEGVLYRARENYSGPWDSSKFYQTSTADEIDVISKLVNPFVEFVEDLSSFTKSSSGYFLISDGTTFETCKYQVAGWMYYYKAVSPGETYKINSWAGQLGRLWFMFDEDGNKVDMSSDSSTASQKEETITIPEGVVLLGVNRGHISVSPPSEISIKVSKLNLVDPSISVFNEETDFIGISRNNENCVRKSSLVNELDLQSLLTGDLTSWSSETGYFLISDGTTFETCKYQVAGWMYYYKAVSPGETYKINSWAGQLGRLWFMFDEDGNKVDMSSDNSTASQKEETITIPEGVVLLGVNRGHISVSPPSTISIEKKIVTIPESHIRDKNPIVLPSDKLYGKTLVVCGDSITYGGAIGDGGTTDESPIRVFQRPSSGGAFAETTTGFIKNYGFDIACRHNMLYYNDGINGSTMQNIDTKHPFSAPNGRYTTLPNNLDYLVIFFGWNDTAYGSLGTIDDNTNDSYYGGYNVVLPYLQNKYPYAKICLVVPYGTDVGHRNAIRLLCNKWGLSCLDMYGAGTPLFFGKEEDVGVLPSVVTANKAKFLSDGTHPNVYGHSQLADMLEQHLMGL